MDPVCSCNMRYFMCICALTGHEHCLFAPCHNVATSYLNMLACKPTLLAVLLTLLVATATCAAVNQTNCDRYRSRKAQVVVQDYILPRAEKLAYTLPESCLIHPQRDMCAVHLPSAHKLLRHAHKSAPWFWFIRNERASQFARDAITFQSIGLCTLQILGARVAAD